MKFDLLTRSPRIVGMFWKSWILTYWPHSQVRRDSAGKIFATMLLHSLFSFICNMTVFWQSWIFSDLRPDPLSPTRGSNTGLGSLITLDMFYIYCTSVCMRTFSKNIDLPSYLRNLSVRPLTTPKWSGGWGEILITVMLIYSHWVIKAYSEKLFDVSFGEMWSYSPKKPI